MENSPDKRIPQYIEAAEQLAHGNFQIQVSTSASDEIGRLGLALQGLAKSLESRYQELQKLNQLTSHINAGILLEEILNQVYQDFRDFIPYDRIGIALLEEDGNILRARWSRTDYPDVKLGRGYFAAMAGSSLQKIMDSAQPRILNDLEAYYAAKPDSESTAVILSEGVRSSLTCPLIANGVPIGFMFFSSRHTHTYANQHVEIYRQIAGQLSVIVEKGRLVSELAAQKEKIEQQYQEVKRLMDLQNTFMGIAAHDLRNPLASIQSISELLLTPAFKLEAAEQLEFFNDIRLQTQHMLLLLNDLLDVTRIEAGKLSLDLVYSEMGRLLLEAVRRNARLAEPKGTHVQLADVPPGQVLVDPTRIRQVLDNLISNAVKYAPPGSLVQVRAFSGEHCWRIEVEDQGPGIRPQEHARLFQDFSRLSAVPTGGEKSTGLGLSISRRVIEAHGGSIGVDSEPGHGSIFWFTLPNDKMDMGSCED
jgi:signal transduction histidine kinase